MTVTTHIAEIVRQGIWASLTGGWYYEPSHTLFCNTFHLYLWLVLLILPMIVGLVSAGQYNFVVITAYTLFIGTLFVILKVIVIHLHNVFDTSDPIISTRSTIDTVSKLDGTHKESGTKVEDIEGIELAEFNVISDEDDLNVLENAQPSGVGRDRSKPKLSRARVEFCAVPSMEEPEESEDELPALSSIEERIRNMETKEISPDENSGKLDRGTSTPEPESSEKCETDKSLDKQGSGPTRLDVSADESEAEFRDGPVGTKQTVRKLSEPAVTIEQRQTDGRFSNDAGEYLRVRRANSTFEPRERRDNEISQRSLEKARKNTNKSYPSKISSDDDFHSLKQTRKRDLDSGFQNQDYTATSEKAIGEKDGDVIQIEDKLRKEFGPRDEDEPCCSKSISTSRPVNRPGTPIDEHVQNNAELGQETTNLDHVGAPSSSSAWIPVVVSLKDIDVRTPSKPHAIALSREDQSTGSSDGSKDIKGEITKFLEDLIDKHPETLDAIESVRLSRLGRIPMRPINTVSRHQGGIRPRSASATVSALSEISVRDGTHVAADHEDTTQGALHSFQDEEGNWWTYSFDEQGVGTAQPLGSGPALMEMIQRERSMDNVKGKAVLDVLPESAYASSEDEAEGSHAMEHQGLNVQTTRRERALSSSSSEGYTYIPPVPTAVFHAATRTGATRSSRPSVRSFGDFSSRVRSAVRPAIAETQHHELDQIIQLLDHGRSSSITDRSRPFGLHSRVQDLLRIDSSDGGPSRRLFTDYQSLGLGTAFGAQGTNSTTLLNSVSAADFSCSTRRPSAVKKSYYYQMKMFPKTDKTIKLKLDRLSVAALFDRNRTVLSCAFDVFLACVVSILAALVLSTGVYFDLNLFMFAFVVAGAHFSLLKSVQPDAASPVHGFNSLVVYSRPIYFSALCLILLLLHTISQDEGNKKIPWSWNPYRISEASTENVLIACRDLLASVILFLPLAFTLGWLPQVNTLAHHILEQIEMHVYGGTASFGVLSAFIQFVKSTAAWILLSAVCHFAYAVDSSSTQTPSFSAFLAVSVGISYVLSRFSSNPELASMLLKSFCGTIQSVAFRSRDAPTDSDDTDGMADPLPSSLRATISLRARHDILFATFISLAVFALHSTSLFTATHPYFMLVIVPLCFFVSAFNHCIYMQLRTHTPFKLVAKPLLRSGEFSLFESTKEAKLMFFERIYVWLLAIEKNILYPLLVVCVLCDAGWSLPLSPLLCPLIALRLLRGAFCHPQLLYVPLMFSFLLTRCDWAVQLPFGIENKLPPPAVFPLAFFVCVLLYPKWVEFHLKISFILAYVAPWQISWGSAFHAFAQPFSVPHSALILAQTALSSLISSPLNPFLGSSFFMTSYVRPVKFWERDYNTKRSDASNTRLASQIDRGPMLDDSNLNAVFYEHLTRSLQKSLAGDLLMGRWATSVEPGDCFILASFYLNCLVHIVEVGNGFVTFQLRGLEFRGTYCHQREVEAISEDQAEGAGFCCCSPGSLPGFLSLNTAWNLRWLAWEVVAGKYVVDGYSITDHSAVNLLQVHELRRLLVTLYVKCIIYYAISSSKLSSWLADETINSSLDEILENASYVDVDHMFCLSNDEDFDPVENGISRASFATCYLEWIQYSLRRKGETNTEEAFDSTRVFAFCYMLSLLGRRALGTASHNRHSTMAESFLYALHTLFKGDFRIQCQRDEWVFADMDLLRCVISPAVKMALKLHQDHFAALEDFDDVPALYQLISDYQTKLFISHEHDPDWRKAILSNTESLLALRHVYDDGLDDYKIIMLNRMHLNMRVIKLNKECVRAFWAGQQQELIFLRNRNPERGSIQNARQVLRNMINSSADQPVGYPIYVSPLTTSFVDTHDQMKNIVGRPITIEGIASTVRNSWASLWSYLGPSTSSAMNQPGGCVPLPTGISTAAGREPAAADDKTSQSSGQMHCEQSVVQMGSDGSARVSLARRPSISSSKKKFPTGDGTPPSTAPRNTAGVVMDWSPIEESSDCKEGSSSICSDDSEDGDEPWVEITDTNQVFKNLCEPLKSTGQLLVEWPSEELRQLTSQKLALSQLTVGMKGRVVYVWYPSHPNKKMRSHIGEKIYLVIVTCLDDQLITIGERGCRIVTKNDRPPSIDGTSEKDNVEESVVKQITQSEEHLEEKR